MVWNAVSWDDCIKAIQAQYGNVVPLFHATTEENAKIIEKEGLKLTYGKNYKHFGEQKNLYFQIGKSDYQSSERNVIFRYDAPIYFIAKYAYADMDSISVSVEQVNELIGRDIEDRGEVNSGDAMDFIMAFVNNGNKLEGLELLIHSEDEDFPEIRPIRVVRQSLIELMGVTSERDDHIERFNRAIYLTYMEQHRPFKKVSEEEFNKKLFNDKFADKIESKTVYFNEDNIHRLADRKYIISLKGGTILGELWVEDDTNDTISSYWINTDYIKL